MKILGVKHSGQLGDIIYSLAFLKSFIKKHGFSHIALYIPNDKIAVHAPGLNHIGDGLMISQAMFDFILPLLKLQSFIYATAYISEHEIPDGVLNLDDMRSGLLNLSAGNIKSYYYKIFGLYDRDVGSWLTTENFDPTNQSKENPQILIGRSTRYLNLGIDYSQLVLLGMGISFIGTSQEFQRFQSVVPNVFVQHLQIKNAAEAAWAIKSSQIFIGNQSLFFAIAEGLNHPRLLESFEPVPNVVPASGCSGSFIKTSSMVNLVIDALNLPNLNQAIFDTNPQYLLSY